MGITSGKVKVSVCVVTYNQEKYIRQCLQSIVDQQTDFDFEVIVSDDYSTDGTRAVVQEFAAKYPSVVKPVLHKENIGAYKNFLFVHAQAACEYIAHMDGDDYALPGKLQAQAQFLDNNSACTAVWHRVDFFDDAGGYCSGKSADLSPFPNGTVYFDDAIRLGYVSVHSSLMYRRSARHPEPNGKEILDLYRTWDLLSSGPGHILDNVFGAYRVSATGSITASSRSKINRISIEHAEHFLRKFPQKRAVFFLFAISHAIICAKNRHHTAVDFLNFAIRNFVYMSPRKIVSNLLDIRRIQVRWKKRKQTVSRTL